MSLESSFLSFLKRKGRNVTILQITETTTENEAGDTIYNTPIEIPTRCRFIDKNEYEKTTIGKVKVKGHYKIGLFKLADAQYLKENNKVKYTDPAGDVETYVIKGKNLAESHYEVVLV